MDRVIFFIDGFNLYHSLDDNPNYHKYKWLNIRKFCECFITKKQEIVKIKYFTTYAHWRPYSYKRHFLYVRALRSANIDITFGKFKQRDKKCHICGKVFKTHEEKQTDVNIALHLLMSAAKDEYDIAMLISGDSDLVPAIETLKLNFPNKEAIIIIPIGRKANELNATADSHRKIKEKHLKACQFNNIIELGNNVRLERPPTWR